MAALGMIFGLLGYGMMFNGYCLIKGYNLTLDQIWSPNWPIAKKGDNTTPVTPTAPSTTPPGALPGTMRNPPPTPHGHGY